MSKGKIALIVIGILVLFGACAVFKGVGWFAGRTIQVAKEELDPRALLDKYEWFKDASASLDRHIANAKGFNGKIKLLEEMYVGTPRKDWPRHDATQWAQWKAEVDGVAAAYTSLAAEYNARMVKINYAFTNRGSLPKGATTVLPREYKPYDIVFEQG